MNMFLNPPPDTVKIQDKEYKLNSDFRYMMDFESRMYKKDENALFYGIYTLFNCELPEDIEQAKEFFYYFYNCGRTPSSKKDEGNNFKRAYDYESDSEYIYAAFLEQYGIDLTTTEMHWWKFCSLFKCLDNDCKMSKIMFYRTVEITNDMSDNQKKFYAEMKELYALPEERIQLEKENEESKKIFEALQNGGDLSALM